MKKEKKTRKKQVSGKLPQNAPAQNHRTANDRQFESPTGKSKYFNPTRPENVGARRSTSNTDSKRKAAGIGTPCDFGSWCVPNRRLNPRNKQDSKIIKRGYDSIYVNQTNPSVARATIDKAKYNKNFNEIDWGKDKKKKKKKGSRYKKKY
jgi:hypothetical protein